MRTARPKRWAVLAALLAGGLAVTALVLPDLGGMSDGDQAGNGQAVLSAGGRRDAPLRIATYNVAAQLAARTAAGDVAGVAAKDRPHVLALQEMGNPDRRARVRRAIMCRSCAYRAYVPSGAVAASTPVLWRHNRLALVKGFSRQVTTPTRVGARGAGPAVIRSKFVNVVHLRDRVTGRHLYVLNNHAVPTVQTGSGRPNTRLPARLGIYRKHMRGLQDIVGRLRSTGAAVFVVGDLNVNYRLDRVAQARLFPYSRMRAVGVRASFEATGLPRRGTHVLRNGYGLRLIDYVYVMRKRGARPLDHRIMGGFSSDHRPVVATVLMKTRT